MIAKQPFVSITVLDGTNSYSRMRLSVKSGLGPEDALNGVEALLLPLSGISGCAVVSFSVTYQFRVEGATNPGPGNPADKVGVFIFDTVEDGQYAMIDVPGISSSCILSGDVVNAGLVVDNSNPAVASFVEFIQSSPFCNPFAADILELGATIVERRL